MLFCKGLLSHLLGSALHTMIWPQPGRQSVAPPTRLAAIFDRIQQLYVENNATTRVTNLKLSMFTDPAKPWQDWPFLKVKGSECKHLLACVATVSAELAQGTDHDHHRTEALKAVSAFVALLDEAATVPSRAHADRAVALMQQFFQHYCWLNSWASAQGRFAYHITIKAHMADHLAENARFLNPTVVWCFKAEHNVGEISEMAHSVSMGVRSTHISTKLSKKYRQFLHFRLTRTAV